MPGAPAVHAALLRRFSPTAFEPGHELTDAQVDVLLDAARFAPSAGNSQPWMFVVGRRGDAVHRRIVRHLAGSSAGWAADASLIVVNIARLRVEGTDWEYSEFSHYDLGQAVAHMTVQGLWMGLGAHQFRAFDRDAITREFEVPREWEVTSMTAFGVAARAGRPAVPGTARERLSRDAVTWRRAQPSMDA